MSVGRVINKLLDAGAVEKHEREISFTTAFGSYLVLSFGQDLTKALILEEWRDVLGRFHPSLESLSCEEIMSIILLLDYYLSHSEMWMAAARS